MAARLHLIREKKRALTQCRRVDPSHWRRRAIQELPSAGLPALPESMHPRLQLEQQQFELQLQQQFQLQLQQLEFQFEPQLQLQLQFQREFEQQLQLQLVLNPRIGPPRRRSAKPGRSPRQAASSEGAKGFQLRLCPPAPAWIWPSASGIAVEQNPHSAESRPTYQCVRPQPGQWFTSFSR